MAGQHMALSDEELAAQESVEHLRLSYRALRNHHEDVKTETQLGIAAFLRSGIEIRRAILDVAEEMDASPDFETAGFPEKLCAIVGAQLMSKLRHNALFPDKPDDPAEPNPVSPSTPEGTMPSFSTSQRADERKAAAASDKWNGNPLDPVEPAPMRIIETGDEKFTMPLLITAIRNGFLLERGGKNEETLYCAGPDEMKASIGASIDKFIAWIAEHIDKKNNNPLTPATIVSAVAEQQAREMLKRAGIENADQIKVGNLVEIISLISGMASLGPRLSKLEQVTTKPACVGCGKPAHYGEFCGP